MARLRGRSSLVFVLVLASATATACAGDSSGMGGSDTEVDAGDRGQPYVDAPDGGGIASECDPWAQDCPRGEKCMPWATQDDASWNATRCTEVAAAAASPGEACAVEGDAWSGIDDCALGSMCWGVDADGVGICVALCGGSPDSPACASAEEGCSVSNGGVLILCLPYCDPLAQDCPVGSACYPETRGFFCSPDASDELGGFGDPCAYLNACDPGLWCAAPGDVPGCASMDGCCSTICDASDPRSACPGAGQVCEPAWDAGSAPPGQSAYGLCAIPG